MPLSDTEHMIREVNLTIARNLSPLYDEAVRAEHPVMIVRGRHERGVLSSREQQLRLLAPYQFHVDVIPEEDDGGFTLWIRELDLGENGRTLAEARQALLGNVRSYVRYFFARWSFFQHLRDKVAQEPYVYRLSLATGDAELAEMLFGTAPGSAASTAGSASPSPTR